MSTIDLRGIILRAPKHRKAYDAIEMIINNNLAVGRGDKIEEIRYTEEQTKQLITEAIIEEELI